VQDAADFAFDSRQQTPRLEVLPAEHVPWLAHPDRVSGRLSGFMRSGSDG
jgi:hypothetical protein